MGSEGVFAVLDVDTLGREKRLGSHFVKVN